MVVEKEGSKTLEASAKADVLFGVEYSAFGTYGDPAATSSSTSREMTLL